MATELKDIEIDYTNRLGHGSFGVVYLAHSKDGVTSAVKQINLEEHLAAGINEAKKCVKLNSEHENIIDIFGIVLSDTRTCIYVHMEYCRLGNLNSFMKKREIDMSTNVRMMMEIARGIAYLHDNDIIHRDIKPDNILIQSSADGSPIVKLSDFGLSKFLEENESSTMGSSVGTPRYKAPEFWMKDKDGKLHYRRRVDLFAAGLTYLAMLQAPVRDVEKKRDLHPYVECSDSLEHSESLQPIGYIMYQRNKNNQAIPNVIATGTDETNQAVRSIIQDMIRYKEEDRPEAADVSMRLESILGKL